MEHWTKAFHIILVRFCSKFLEGVYMRPKMKVCSTMKKNLSTLFSIAGEMR